MPSYNVEWSIEVNAESPEAAARQALAIQRNPESIATVFKVWDEDGDGGTVDLTQIDEEA